MEIFRVQTERQRRATEPRRTAVRAVLQIVSRKNKLVETFKGQPRGLVPRLQSKTTGDNFVHQFTALLSQ